VSEWDAAAYDRVAAPMTERGLELVDRLELDGDETVMDAGCGTGQVTERLLARLPRGRVIALDASQAMLDRAAERLDGLPPPPTLAKNGAQARQDLRIRLLELERAPQVGLGVGVAQGADQDGRAVG